VKYAGPRSGAGRVQLVYDAVVTTMGIIHGLVGVSWMGMHVSNEILVVPDIRKAQKLADAPILRSLKKISVVAAVLGFLTLITGIIFMYVRWALDFGRILNEPEPRAVFIALILILVVLVLGMGLLRPLGMNIGKDAAGFKPMEDFPAEFKAKLHRLGLLLHISSALVVGGFIMMIIAINGGI
jgi:hypothetical protein